MGTVKNGKYVELAYELSEIDGTNEETMLVMTKEHPECIVFGVEQNVIPALLNALEGKTVGDTFDTVIEPKDAFGEFNEKLLMTLERELFERDGKFDNEHVHNGAVITMMTAEGYPVQGLVLNVGDKNVQVDFNHPLAGKTVRFKGEILTVRDATEQELHPSCSGGCSGCSGCGDGGHDHNCGGCGDGCGH